MLYVQNVTAIANRFNPEFKRSDNDQAIVCRDDEYQVINGAFRDVIVYRGTLHECQVYVNSIQG